jgi:hypothetical protein
VQYPHVFRHQLLPFFVIMLPLQSPFPLRH